MEKSKCRMVIGYASVLLLGLISATACITAEFKKTKEKDLKLDGTLCSLPGSSAFGLGVSASISLFAAQIVGTCAIAYHLFSKERKISPFTRRKAVSITLFLLSWTTFGFAMILIGVAASMNHAQRYGVGWLQRNCYVVNNGVFAGASVLVMATIIFTVGCIFTARMRYRTVGGDQGRRVHAQGQGIVRGIAENYKEEGG